MSSPLSSRLQATGRLTRWRQGDHLLREGEQAGAVILIEEGSVKVVSHTTGGSETVHAVLGSGAVLGELAALDGRPHAATAIALGPGSGRRVTADEFRTLLHDDVDSTVALAQLLADRIRGADRSRNDLDSGDVETRVARRLWHLCADASGAGAESVIAITQDDLARWCGASRQAVNGALARLRAAGTVETRRGGILVLDRSALRSRAGL